MQEVPENQHPPTKRRPRLNPVAPLDRIWIGREDVANVFSVSPGMVDVLVNDKIIRPHRYFRSLPRWHVKKLQEESDKLLDKDQDSDDWRPEL